MPPDKLNIEPAARGIVRIVIEPGDLERTERQKTILDLLIRRFELAMQRGDLNADNARD